MGRGIAPDRTGNRPEYVTTSVQSTHTVRATQKAPRVQAAPPGGTRLRVNGMRPLPLRLRQAAARAQAAQDHFTE